MDLETLRKRREELENSSLQIANSWQTVQGHKQEVQYWISELEKAHQCVDSLPESPLE